MEVGSGAPEAAEAGCGPAAPARSRGDAGGGLPLWRQRARRYVYLIPRPLCMAAFRASDPVWMSAAPSSANSSSGRGVVS